MAGIPESLDPIAPSWFTENVSAPYSSHFVDVQNCSIHYLHWRAKSLSTSTSTAGIIFVHGNAAHAHWWSFLAPFFSKDCDCIAVSNSGSGESGWRDEYSFELWAEELVEAAKAAHIWSAESLRCKPVIVAHSLGVFVAVALAMRFGDQVGGLILLDEICRPQEYMDKIATNLRPTVQAKDKHVLRPGSVSPRSRFSLAPPQPVRNKFLLDYVADHSVRREGESWSWSFDPQKTNKFSNNQSLLEAFKRFVSPQVVLGLKVRTTFVVGSASIICEPSLLEWNRRELGQDIPFIEVHDSGHHLMFDQPLALVAAIQATLAEWRRSQLTNLGTPRLESRASHSSFYGSASDIPVLLFPQKSKL